MTSYLIECSFRVTSQSRHFAFVERDSDAMGQRDTAFDIATGQVENVERIVGFDLENKRSYDATAEIAEEVAEVCMTEYGRIPERLRDWIDEHVGLRAAAE